MKKYIDAYIASEENIINGLIAEKTIDKNKQPPTGDQPPTYAQQNRDNEKQLESNYQSVIDDVHKKSTQSNKNIQIRVMINKGLSRYKMRKDRVIKRCREYL